MRTTIDSSGGAFEWFRLCWLSVFADKHSSSFSTPTEDLLTGDSGCDNDPECVGGAPGFVDSGTISRVEMISLPPAGVNLHALLRGETSVNKL